MGYLPACVDRTIYVLLTTFSSDTGRMFDMSLQHLCLRHAGKTCRNFVTKTALSRARTMDCLDMLTMDCLALRLTLGLVDSARCTP